MVATGHKTLENVICIYLDLVAPTFVGSCEEILWILYNQSAFIWVILSLSKWIYSRLILDLTLPVRLYNWFVRPTRHGFCSWNFIAIMSTSWDISTSGLAVAILHFRLPVTCGGIIDRCTWMPGQENVGVLCGRWNLIDKTYLGKVAKAFIWSPSRVIGIIPTIPSPPRIPIWRPKAGNNIIWNELLRWIYVSLFLWKLGTKFQRLHPHFLGLGVFVPPTCNIMVNTC